jgi:hypothetical protein
VGEMAPAEELRSASSSITSLAPVPSCSICRHLLMKRSACARSFQGGESQYRSTLELLWSAKIASVSDSTKGRSRRRGVFRVGVGKDMRSAYSRKIAG